MFPSCVSPVETLAILVNLHHHQYSVLHMMFSIESLIYISEIKYAAYSFHLCSPNSSTTVTKILHTSCDCGRTMGSSGTSCFVDFSRQFICLNSAQLGILFVPWRSIVFFPLGSNLPHIWEGLEWVVEESKQPPLPGACRCISLY